MELFDTTVLQSFTVEFAGEDCTGTVSAHADFVFFFFFGEKCEKKVVLIRAQCSVL